jgi:hypothetical protein
MENVVTISVKVARAALIALGESEEGARFDAKRAADMPTYQKRHEDRAAAFNRAAQAIKAALDVALADADTGETK